MRRVYTVLMILTFLVSKASALDFYVSPNATGTGDGSFGNPWKLQQALDAPQVITNPKDTIWIWLRAGVYKGTYNAQVSFNCFTKGNKNAPIIFRNYNNERAILDGNLSNTLFMGLGNCSYTWFWGLEILNTDTSDRDHSNLSRAGNVYCTAENIKFINLIIHDMGSGIDSWKSALNCEIYGCLIYNIGNNQLNGTNWEGHGHGLYLQNDTIGEKLIHNNVIFSTFGYGIKAWQTTNTSAIGNFNFQKNIVFNGGAASENLGGAGNNYRTHNFFIVSNGSNNPIRNTIIKHNYTYAGLNTPRPPVNAFGLNFGVDNLILDSNYITCQTRLGLSNTPIFNASVKGNRIIAGIPTSYGYYLWGFTEANYPDNTFLSSIPASGLEYFILPNKFEKERSHIAIYNMEGTETVQIDLSGYGWKKGDQYVLSNVMDYYGDKVTGTVAAASLINVPMNNHSAEPVIGSKKAQVSQFPYFGAFVIQKVGHTLVNAPSFDQENIHRKLRIYPNPTGNSCDVKVYVNQPGEYQLTIIDIHGKTVLENPVLINNRGNYDIAVDLQHLSNGYYLVQLKNSIETFNGKVIIQR